MSKDIHSYKSIFKAISLFGGLKIFQIIIGIIKNKFIAIILGPTGMGIAGMITSTTSFVSSLTDFAIESSAVRDVAQAHSSGNKVDVSKIIYVLKKITLVTGILGMLLTFIFSTYLSKMAFGNAEYSLAFKVVSIILLMNQLSIGQSVLLQGTFQYKSLIRASFIGSVLGLIITVPLYYIYEFKAIVPAIILSSFFNLLLTWIYSLKVPYAKVNLNFRQILFEGKAMLILGVTIAITGIINTGQVFVLRTVISKIGGLSDVGLYVAGMTIATSYINIVFNAMSSDYSPRLASVANDRSKMIEIINKQAILLTVILAPLIFIFVMLIRQITIILYSVDFLGITGMIEWVMFGMFFRAISWSISYSFVAYNKPKIFLINTIISSSYSLFFSIIGFFYLGFDGLGIAFCITNFIYSFHMFFLARKTFGFYFNYDFIRKTIPLIFLSTIFFILIKATTQELFRSIFGGMSFLILLILSYKQLKNLLEFASIKELIKRKHFKY